MFSSAVQRLHGHSVVCPEHRGNLWPWFARCQARQSSLANETGSSIAAEVDNMGAEE